MHTPLSSKLRVPFQHAHDAVWQAFDAIDPNKAIIDRLVVAWGTQRDRNGTILPSEGTPTSPVLELCLKPSVQSRHQAIQTNAQARAFFPLWEETHAPLLTTLVNSMTILQGPESMGVLTWFQRNSDANGVSFHDVCFATLHLNHQDLHKRALHVPTLHQDLLLCLDRLVTTTAGCAPATHHFIITAPRATTGPHVTSTVAAANIAQARTFITAMDPDHWAHQAHKLAFAPTP